MRLQLHRRTVGALQHVAVDQPGRRDSGETDGVTPSGKPRSREALEHLLAREVVVGAVVEGERTSDKPYSEIER